MGRRTLLLIASILVAALGTALIWLYVQGADSRAQAGETKVEVLVSNTAIEAGRPISEVRPHVVRRSLPQSFVASFGSDLVTDPNKISGFTATPLLPGMPLLMGQFVRTQTAPAPAVALNPNKLAMQVSLPDPQRLAGLLQPGSLVRIYASVKDKRGASTAKPLLDQVRVLASGPVAQAATGPGTGAKADVPQAIVTLEVDDAQARLLVATQTQDSGGRNLWFGLLGAKVPPAAGILDTTTAAG